MNTQLATNKTTNAARKKPPAGKAHTWWPASRSLTTAWRRSRSACALERSPVISATSASARTPIAAPKWRERAASTVSVVMVVMGDLLLSVEALRPTQPGFLKGWLRRVRQLHLVPVEVGPVHVVHGPVINLVVVGLESWESVLLQAPLHVATKLAGIVRGTVAGNDLDRHTPLRAVWHFHRHVLVHLFLRYVIWQPEYPAQTGTGCICRRRAARAVCRTRCSGRSCRRPRPRPSRATPSARRWRG